MNFLFVCVVVVAVLASLATAKKLTIGNGKSSSLTLTKSNKKSNSDGDRLVSVTAAVASVKPSATVGGIVAPASGLPSALKLLIGVSGIYASFLYYGTLQEDVFSFTAADGSKFRAAWFLQALEALANVIVGGLGLLVTGGSTKGLPLKMFALAGTSQVFAKAFTSLALASGVSFPIVTLAKSGKMVPVMLGSILLGGASYTLRQYLSVASIIAGTCMVSMGKKTSKATSSLLGLSFVALSLSCDGITGGMQGRLKTETKKRGLKVKPYDFMFWTNAFMTIVAAAIAVCSGELVSGINYCSKNPVILDKILRFGLCSAIGQSFIFYTITNFDALVCTTVTTTRKVFSVLLSIFLKGHAMSAQGWAGIVLASLGILSEIQDKGSKAH